MHRAFFGRRHEVDDLVRLLRSSAKRGEGQIVVMVGPSGCGKSSLVRAGLMPAMAIEPGWATLAPFMPGTDPIAALSQELAHATRSTPSQIRRQLGEDKGLVLAVEDLLSAGAPPRQRLLVVIDQFEEILTRSSVTGRAQLAAMLRPAIAGPVQVVVTIRSEFLDSLLADSAVAQLPIHCVTLRPLDAAVLPRVIEGPARLAGLDVNPELISRMVVDTASGDALPLLAFTLEQLATGLPRGAPLSPQRYDHLGGVQGALTHQADLALTDALTANTQASNGRSRTDVLDSLLRLVTVDEMDQLTRLDVDYQQLPPPVRVELDAFVAHRLLTTTNREETVLLGVAHEAFLTAWPPLAQAISAAGTALRMRRMLEQAAAEWEHADRRTSFLWDQDRLAAAVSETGAQLRWVHPDRPGAQNATGRYLALRGHREMTSGRVELGPAARTFLHASIRHQQRRRHLFFTAVAAVLVVAFAITAIAVIQRQIAEGQRQIAEDQKELATVRGLVAQAESRRGSDLRLALQLGIAAHRIRPTVETGTSLYTTLTSTPLMATLTGSVGPMKAMAFSPDGHTLTTAAGKAVELWDITGRTSASRTVIQTSHLNDTATQTNYLDVAALSPDGDTLANSHGNGIIWLWDLTNSAQSAPTATLTGHNSLMRTMAFSPDGRTLATGSDQVVELWNVTNPSHPTRTTTLTTPAFAMAFSPDGRTLATVGDRAVELWNVTDPSHPTRTTSLADRRLGDVFAVAFSSNGRNMAVGDSNGTTWLWDLINPAQPTHTITLPPTVTGPTRPVVAVVFSPDGRTLATSDGNYTIGLWDMTSRTQSTHITTLAGHNSSVWEVAFSPNGHILATGSSETGLWDMTDPSHPARTATLRGHADDIVRAVAFSPDGHTLATGSNDGTVELWDIANPTHPIRTLTGPQNFHGAVTFSLDGRRLARGTNDHTVELWDLTNPVDPARTATLTVHPDSAVVKAFSTDGHTLATSSDDGTIELWDINDPIHPTRIVTLVGHPDYASAVAFSQDGRTLVTGSNDGTVELWDINDPVHASRTVTFVGHAGAVMAVAFSQDGRTLATGSSDGTTGLWDITDPPHPARTATLISHINDVWAVTFSPDGRTLITGSNGSDTAAVWDVRGILEMSGHLINWSCVAAGGGLAQEQWDAFAPGIPYRPTC